MNENPRIDISIVNGVQSINHLRVGPLFSLVHQVTNFCSDEDKLIPAEPFPHDMLGQPSV